MKLPAQLLHVRAQFDAAILDHAIPGDWPEGEKFVKADAPRAIAQVFLRSIRDELKTAKIAYLFKESMKRGEMVLLGKASKASGPAKFLHHCDFVLVFNWTAWKVLSNEQRLALVDHELLHCAFDVEKGFSLVHHDVEDFVAIVDRWGLWTRGLQEMMRAVTPAEQRSLFEAPPVRDPVLDRILDDAEAGRSPLQPAPGSGIESVTISSGDRAVTLTQDGAGDEPWRPAADQKPEEVGAALAAAAAKGADEMLDEPPIRRPRERLVHRKQRPRGRGKDAS